MVVKKLTKALNWTEEVKRDVITPNTSIRFSKKKPVLIFFIHISLFIRLRVQNSAGACIEHIELQSSLQLRDILPVAFRSDWAL